MRELSVEDIEELYGRYGENVLYRCRQLLRNEAAAWDAMHQTFVRALKYRRTYGGRSEPISWLYTIATRVCFDEIRRRPPEDEAVDAPADEGLASLESQLSDKRQVARLLSHFSAGVQEIVVMKYFDELEVKEIADRTGLSERTIARRLKKFLARARKLVGVSP